MERRHFLKLFSVAAPVSTAAVAQLHKRPEGCENIADAVEAAKMRAKMSDFVTHSDPKLAGFMDRRAHADYDLMLIPAGVTVPDFWSFFTEPIGAPHGPYGRGLSVPQFTSKSMVETNMYRANCFPPPESRHHERVVFIFSPEMDEADRDDLATRFYWEYRMCDKVMGRAPLLLNRVMGDIADLVSLDNGKRKPVPIEAPYCAEFRKPVYVPPLAHFSLELRSHEGGFMARKPIALYAFLDGIGDFPIQ